MDEALADPDLEAAVFASGSAVRGFLSLGGPVQLPVVTIGPRTTAIARESGFEVIVEAGGRDARQLAAAVAATFPTEVTTHG